jgi:serpin B
LPEFLDLCTGSYRAQVEPLDFSSDSEAARQRVNRWLWEQSEERLPALLEPGDVAPDTTMALTDVVHFRGEWLNPFDASFTETADFTRADGSVVELGLMHQVGSFGYFEGEEFQMLELPYSGESLSMVVVLPGRHDGLRRIEEELSVDRLAEWIGSLEATEVRAMLPRFTTGSKLELSDTLRAMGMHSAFGPEADFSGITGERDLWIDLLVHGTVLEVDEGGTEAAASTAVVLKKGPRPIEFRADHPFLFLIRDRLSGSVLFLGRLVHPGI